jgi:hypothetical protein
MVTTDFFKSSSLEHYAHIANFTFFSQNLFRIYKNGQK